MHLSRRTFILCAMSALSLTGIASFFPSGFFRSPESFIKKLDPRFYDIALGEQYLRSYPQNAGKNALFGHLCSRLNLTGGKDESAWLAHAIPRAIEEDCRKGHIVQLDGWLLPKTAVYLSALAASVEHHVC